MRSKEIVLFGLTATALGFLANSAFSTPVRKEIGRRDDWECQGEGDCSHCAGGRPKRFDEGWMVDAAHYPELHHKRNNPLYDTPDAGRIRCIEGHIIDHERGTTLGDKADQYAIERLQERDERTYAYRRGEIKPREEVIVYQARLALGGTD